MFQIWYDLSSTSASEPCVHGHKTPMVVGMRIEKEAGSLRTYLLRRVHLRGAAHVVILEIGVYVSLARELVL